jgi:hypothetical protein
MTWEDLKPEQVRALLEIVTRHGAFYHRLVKRLEELRLPPADPLYARVWHLAGNVEALRSLLEDSGKARATPPCSQSAADVEARQARQPR